MEQELRLKREAAERAFEAQAEKDRTLMRLEELRSGVGVGVMLMWHPKNGVTVLRHLRLYASCNFDNETKQAKYWNGIMGSCDIRMFVR
ncbi:hypothetical protein Tco_1278776 [Tanacetum coccineum]